MTEPSVLIIFPNQLFKNHPALKLGIQKIILIEDSLFFGDYKYQNNFHKQKLWFHRASMKNYASWLEEKGLEVVYEEHCKNTDNLLDALKKLKSEKNSNLIITETHDYELNRRLFNHALKLSLKLEILPSPMFLNSDEENTTYRNGKKRWFMADFYKFQRRRLNLLMEGDQPLGGKWSYDEDNRKKVPKNLVSSVPSLMQLKRSHIDKEAVKYVQEKYPTNIGNVDNLIYPTTHSSARRWLDDFLNNRFSLFGDYEDAILSGENWLWHSVLTPVLNVGLITPKQVIEAAKKKAKENDVPINSVEGFFRQIIGWREFMHATYVDLGGKMRTTNHWNHHRKIPQSFYTGTTGIDPIDDVIRRVINTGYCHHIERLMILGGFMFICEFDPNEIYQWFMEMFVDSYDWVMVPNVYAMSQNADGGLITTKPYFSGSSYVKKMSNFKPGDWCQVWDGLYWRWILNHCDQLSKNPRWSMMCAMAMKMTAEKKNTHLENAEKFLSSL
ncbi:cryptochrome/photolyase family protein [Verrucomicrobiales bacterium]|nr:cryptochrome/photolyase family protein [Verrucomicrobiales bacterium]